MSLSEERLADIRARHSAGLGLERPGDVAALLAEVKRLREGIEMLVEHPTWHRGMYGCPRDMVSTDRLTDLLNPTGGETDEWR